METPKPGDKTIKLQVQTKAGPGKVYDWKHYNKNILITKEAPAPAAAEMTPNDAGKSLEDLGLQKGDLYHDGGNTFKVVNVTKYNNIETENLTTGGSLFVHKGFVPESYTKTSTSPAVQKDKAGTELAPGDPVEIYGTPGFTYQGPEPASPEHALVSDPNGQPGEAPIQVPVAELKKGVEPPPPPPAPPSAPIPAHGPQTLGDLNVGDKYKIDPHEWEVMQKDDLYTTVKNEQGDTIPMPHDTPFSTPPTITYKAPPPTAGGSSAGQLGGMPTVHDMPIDPYLWHKGGGGQTYVPINKLQPGDQFSDKSGNKHTVVKHSVKKLEDATATTTVQGPNGGTFDVPTHFTNDKGKTVPTRVYKLASTAPVPEFIEPQPEPQPDIPGHMTTAQADNLLTNVSTQGGDHTTNGWNVSYANSGGYHVTSPGGVTHNDLSHDQAYGWMVHGAEPAAEPTLAPTPTTWDKLRVGDLVNSGSGASPFKVTADHDTHWEITSTKDGSSTDIPKNSALTVVKTGHEKGPTLPEPVNDDHYKAQRIADQWLKQHKMPAEDIADIHQKVADFLPKQNQWGPGEAYAQAISGHTQFKTPGDYQGNPHELTKQIDQKLQVGKLVTPHELGKGDVFSNPEGGQFEVTAKADEATHFKKLSGTGAAVGTLHDDSPVKYTLVSKGQPPILPSAEATAIPAPADDAHFAATNAADHWMLDNGVPSKTANWVHAEAAKQKQQHPNWGWGESYAAALPPEAMDDPNNMQALKDLLDQKPPEPVVEKLPPAAPKPGLGEMPDYTGTELTPSGDAGGTTGAQFATDPTGKQWLIKSYDGNENRVATELLANSVYRSMGLESADAGTLVQNGQTKLAYPLVDGEHTEWRGTDQAKMKALGQGIMTDALTGNWDFAGTGGPKETNVLWNGNEPTRIDQGGTFFYRAQGQPKPFGPVPLEVKSLLTGGGQGVKGVSVSEPEMRQQAAQIAATLTPDKIDQLVDAAPFTNQKMKDDIRTNLKARVQWMQEFADGQHSDMLDGVKLASAPAPPPPPPTPKPPADVFTAEHKTAFSAAQKWLTQQGLPLGTIAKIHGSAIDYHDKGSDWPTAYMHAAGDHAAPQLSNNHAQIASQIKKALGGATSTEPQLTTVGSPGPLPQQMSPNTAGTQLKDLPVGTAYAVPITPGAWHVTKITGAQDGQGIPTTEGQHATPSYVPKHIWTPPTPPTPEPPSYAAKYQVGHQVSYAVPGGGTKTGTIAKDVSPSSTQHAYQMGNGDHVAEDSIAGLAPGEPAQPKPKWTPEPTGTPSAPHVEDMPISPYAWHKGGGGQTYTAIASLKPGAEFTDKSGTKYRVVSSTAGVTVVEPLASPGTTIAVPQSFIAKSGKIRPTHVHVS
jgi:hypothetical protein